MPPLTDLHVQAGFALFLLLLALLPLALAWRDRRERGRARERLRALREEARVVARLSLRPR